MKQHYLTYRLQSSDLKLFQYYSYMTIFNGLWDLTLYYCVCTTPPDGVVCVCRISLL